MKHLVVMWICLICHQATLASDFTIDRVSPRPYHEEPLILRQTGATFLGQLLSLHEQAQKPLAQDLVGLWAGRCYFPSSPSLAWPTALLVQKTAHGTLAVPLLSLLSDPFHFDNKTPEEVFREIRPVIQWRAHGDLLQDSATAGSLVMQVEGGEFQIRQYQSVFILKIERNKTTSAPSRAPSTYRYTTIRLDGFWLIDELLKNETAAACQYFKKIEETNF